MKLWLITAKLLDKDNNPEDELTEKEVLEAFKFDAPANCDVEVLTATLLDDFSVKKGD